MSWYTMAYIAIMDKDEKIYPWGPYDAGGKLRPVFEHSRSFTSDLKEDFLPITEKNLTDELREAFPFETGSSGAEGWKNDGEIYQYFGYLPISELPSGSFVKNGYCLLEQINAYLSDDYFEGFYNVLTPAEYAMKLENELKFGAPKPKTDCDGCEYTEPSCSEYSYFAWPDYNCREYEAFLIREAVEMLHSYKIKDDGYKFVAIKTEG